MHELGLGCLSSLLQQRNQTEMDLLDKLGTYKEGHPIIKEARARLAGIDQTILQQIETLRDAMQTRFEIVRQREQSLLRNLEDLRKETIDLSKRNLAHDRLEEIYQQNKRFLEDMLARSNEADLSATAWMNNIRIIEPAVAPGG